mgnify:CR=1 FL=1
MSLEKILCFGSLNPDLIYFVDEIPKKGDDIRSSDSLVRAGGTAINCAEKIVLWNKSVHVRGNSIGNDELGTYLVKHLNNLEIVHKDVIKENLVPGLKVGKSGIEYALSLIHI